jgi:hypothetical protein
MSHKFGKDREVSVSYAKIPLYYTGIKHPHQKHKELVLLDDFGKHYSACYRNNDLCKLGIEFLLRKIKGGFVFKDKEYKFNGSSGWVY